MTPSVTIGPRGENRLRSGHLWVYRADIVDVRASAGDKVEVKNERGRILGGALYSDRSQIALRLLSRGEEPAGESLWRSRLEAAIAFRKSLAIDATAYRLVHGEGDLLPSFIVDRYGDFLVVQALSQGTDHVLPEIVPMLIEMLSPAGILARNDARVRLLEGLEQRVDVLYGEVPETVVVSEGAVEVEVDLWKGQKTGLFLDQRENRAAAARYARGRMLDAFSYNGGFALQMARSAEEVVALDISEDAVARITANAERNHLSQVHARVANAFDFLREAERRGERFDTIVLDPPAFAKNKASLPRALSGYKEINLRAFKMLAAGGTLVSCSCSYHVSEEMLARTVHEAALDAHVQTALVEKRTQGRDHPMLLGVPETSYLKCFILRKLTG